MKLQRARAGSTHIERTARGRRVQGQLRHSGHTQNTGKTHFQHQRCPAAIGIARLLRRHSHDADRAGHRKALFDVHRRLVIAVARLARLHHHDTRSGQRHRAPHHRRRAADEKVGRRQSGAGHGTEREGGVAQSLVQRRGEGQRLLRSRHRQQAIHSRQGVVRRAAAGERHRIGAQRTRRRRTRRRRRRRDGRGRVARDEARIIVGKHWIRLPVTAAGGLDRDHDRLRPDDQRLLKIGAGQGVRIAGLTGPHDDFARSRDRQRTPRHRAGAPDDRVADRQPRTRTRREAQRRVAVGRALQRRKFEALRDRAHPQQPRDGRCRIVGRIAGLVRLHKHPAGSSHDQLITVHRRRTAQDAEAHRQPRTRHRFQRDGRRAKQGRRLQSEIQALVHLRHVERQHHFFRRGHVRRPRLIKPQGDRAAGGDLDEFIGRGQLRGTSRIQGHRHRQIQIRISAHRHRPARKFQGYIQLNRLDGEILLRALDDQKPARTARVVRVARRGDHRVVAGQHRLQRRSVVGQRQRHVGHVGFQLRCQTQPGEALRQVLQRDHQRHLRYRQRPRHVVKNIFVRRAAAGLQGILPGRGARSRRRRYLGRSRQHRRRVPGRESLIRHRKPGIGLPERPARRHGRHRQRRFRNGEHQRAAALAAQIQRAHAHRKHARFPRCAGDQARPSDHAQSGRQSRRRKTQGRPARRDGVAEGRAVRARRTHGTTDHRLRRRRAHRVALAGAVTRTQRVLRAIQNPGAARFHV